MFGSVFICKTVYIFYNFSIPVYKYDEYSDPYENVNELDGYLEEQAEEIDNDEEYDSGYESDDEYENDEKSKSKSKSISKRHSELEPVVTFEFCPTEIHLTLLNSNFS